MGLDFFWDQRFSEFNIGLETNYRRNLLTSDPEDVDENYVQTFPKLHFNLMPQSIWQSQNQYLHRFTYGIDGDITTYRQMESNDQSTGFLRNATRLNTNPYISANLLNLGPLTLAFNENTIKGGTGKKNYWPEGTIFYRKQAFLNCVAGNLVNF